MTLSKRLGALIVAFIMSLGLAVAMAPAAQAGGYVVVSQGIPKRVGPRITCTQWFAAMNGARVQNARVEPRIQYKAVGSNKRHARTLGGLARATSPGKEIRTARDISRWRGGGSRPSNPWKFSRLKHPGKGRMQYRCVLFFSGRGLDSQGNRYNIASTRISGWRAL